MTLHSALKVLLICLTCLAPLVAGEMRMDLVNASIWLSNAAYCPTDSYLTHTYLGSSLGFQPSHVLVDNYTDTHGFVGVMKDKKAVFVVFRGSYTISNWISDIDGLLVYYDKCRLCFVHRGFYMAYQAVASQVLVAVADLLKRNPSYKVIVTGHSLGGALATLAAADILQHGTAPAADLQLVTFGSPRVGNEYFSSSLTASLQALRWTHAKDPVPHLPPQDQSYRHVGQEVYEDERGALRDCASTEDPSCSNQWYLTDAADHMLYNGLKIGCKFVSEGAEVV